MAQSLLDQCLIAIAKAPRHDLMSLPAELYEKLHAVMVNPALFMERSVVYVRTKHGCGLMAVAIYKVDQDSSLITYAGPGSDIYTTIIQIMERKGHSLASMTRVNGLLQYDGEFYCEKRCGFIRLNNDYLFNRTKQYGEITVHRGRPCYTILTNVMNVSSKCGDALVEAGLARKVNAIPIYHDYDLGAAVGASSH